MGSERVQEVKLMERPRHAKRGLGGNDAMSEELGAYGKQGTNPEQGTIPHNRTPAPAIQNTTQSPPHGDGHAP